LGKRSLASKRKRSEVRKSQDDSAKAKLEHNVWRGFQGSKKGTTYWEAEGGDRGLLCHAVGGSWKKRGLRHTAISPQNLHQGGVGVLGVWGGGKPHDMGDGTESVRGTLKKPLTNRQQKKKKQPLGMTRNEFCCVGWVASTRKCRTRRGRGARPKNAEGDHRRRLLWDNRRGGQADQP